ncbi:MAG TPA: glycosyltransferase [bacterium]|nr:glycosyltransferase family 4 protein [Chlamydiota bacterium]HOE27846.1 glycosyltransferase [bacterium]
MKILWLTDDFLPHYGGSRLLYFHTMVRFPPGEVRLLTKRRPGWREFDRREGLRAERGFFPALPGRPPFSMLAVYAEMLLRGMRAMARERPDAIVCGEIFPTACVGRALGALWRVPYVVYVHGEELNVLKKLRTGARLMRSILLRAGAVVASATTPRDEALRQGVPPERLHLLRPAVDDAFFSRTPSPRAARGRYGIGDGPLLLTVGRLVERKGHEDVLRLFPSLAEEFPGLAYLIVGAGPAEERLRRAAREAGAEGAVIFAGRIGRDELLDCYAACDVFVMPNREMSDGDTEGACIVLLEAAACGKPVVAGVAGGTADSVADGETGFLVDPAAPGELGRALRVLLGDAARRRRMGEEGRKRVSGRRWEACARDLRSICATVGGGGGATR